jgi:hypothetical protein
MMPKVYFLFYQYFYKAAIGDATWKSRLTKNKRLGPVILEAYTHATLYNQYFAWLYEYKANHPASTLVTQYDPVPQAADSDGGEESALFSGNLDLLEVSVPEEIASDASTDQPSTAAEQELEQGRPGGIPRTTTWSDFKLLLAQQEEEHEAAREHGQNVAREIRRCIDADRTRAGSAGGGDDTTVSSRLDRYRYVQSIACYPTLALEMLNHARLTLLFL